MKIPRTALVFSIGLLTTLVGAVPVYASTFASQLLNTSYGVQGAGNYPFQTIGTGFSGLVTQFQMQEAFGPAAGSSVYGWYMNSCTNAAMTVGCVTVFDRPAESQFTISSAAQATSTLTYTPSTPISLNPTLYYAFGVLNFSGSTRLGYILGAGSDVYSGGDCKNGGGTVINPPIDCYFTISGTFTQISSPSVSVVQPVTGSTTASTLVFNQMTYNAPTSLGTWNNWVWTFQDVTQSSGSFTLTGSITTGSLQTVNRTVNLTSGHTYNSSVQICLSPTGLGQCYTSDIKKFSVVSSNFSIGTTFPNVNSTTSSASGTINYQLPVPIFTQINDTNASSSIDQAINAFQNIPGMLSHKVPFGYIWDIRDIYNQAATSSTGFSDIYLDFTSTSISTSTRSYLSTFGNNGRILILGTSTVTYYLNNSILNGFNAIASAVMSLGWLAYAFYRIKGEITPTA